MPKKASNPITPEVHVSPFDDEETLVFVHQNKTAIVMTVEQAVALAHELLKAVEE